MEIKPHPNLDQLLQSTGIRAALIDRKSNIVYASPALIELYEELTKKKFSYGKCYKIFHDRTDQEGSCRLCPFRLNSEKGKSETTRLSRLPFCEGLLKKHSSYFAEYFIDAKVQKHKASHVVMLVRKTPHHEYDELYKLASNLYKINKIEDLFQLTLKQFYDLKFKGVRLYRYDTITESFQTVCALSADGENEEHDLILTRKTHPASYYCIDKSPMPTFIKINPEKANNDEYNRDEEDINLRIRYIMKDHHTTLGERDGWFDVPLYINGKIIGKISCNITNETFLFRDQLYTINIFSKLFAQAIIRLENDITMSKRSMLMSAHEVATPLQMIMANVEYIKDFMGKNNILSREIELVLKDTINTTEEIAFMNRFAKLIASGDKEWKIEPIDMYDDIFLPTIKMLSRFIDNSGRKIYYPKEEIKKIPTLYLDRLRIQEVVHNLLANAIKYSFDNSIIKIHVTLKDGWIISVSNQGITVPAGMEKKIFDEGFRTEEAKRVDFTGTGNGLFYSAIIMKEMTSWIKLANNINPTIFSFWLPRKTSQPNWKER